MLLAIDTSAGTSAAVFRGDELVAFELYDDPFGHAENIGLAIQKVLATAGISAKELTQLAVGRGPAPYTGLRVGIAAGTSLASALGIRPIGVITLDAVGLQHTTGRVLVVADAKRKEFFAAGFDAGQQVLPPSVLSAVELAQKTDFELVSGVCDARLVGQYALHALANGDDLSDVSALYLRSPDVTPSPGKKVTG